MLIFGVSPFASFIPSCVNGFCGVEEPDGLDTLILGLPCSASFKAAEDRALELGEDCDAPPYLLVPSPFPLDCVGA